MRRSSIWGCGGENIVRRQRTPNPLECELTHRLNRYRILDRHENARTDQDLTGLSFVAKTRGDVGYRATRGVVEAPFKSDSAEGRISMRYTDAKADVRLYSPAQRCTRSLNGAEFASAVLVWPPSNVFRTWRLRSIRALGHANVFGRTDPCVAAPSIIGFSKAANTALGAARSDNAETNMAHVHMDLWQIRIDTGGTENFIILFTVRGSSPNRRAAARSLRPSIRTAWRTRPYSSTPFIPALCQSSAKGYLLPDFYSGGATERSGRSFEGLLLRRLDPHDE
jgi:hypothetical protein